MLFFAKLQKKMDLRLKTKILPYHMRMKSFIFALFLLLCTLPASAQSEGYAPASGVEIYYRVWGEGTPILIINGGPGGNSEGFGYIARLLATKYQAIIFDQRGTGKSKLPCLDSTTITMDFMIQDMEALRKHLKIKKWVVMGQSFGGMLAAYYASYYPKSMQGLIFSASGGLDLKFMDFAQKRIQDNLNEEEQKALAYWSEKIAQGDTTYHARSARAKALAPAYVVDKTHAAVIAERLLQVNMKINSLVFNELRKMNFDCKGKLRQFRKPVLILHGRQDIIAPEIAETAHKVFRHSRLVMLDNCAHYGWLDQKTQYIAEIDRFMSAL